MSDAAVIALFARLRWKMLRGVLSTRGALQVAVVVGLIASVTVGAIAAAVVVVLGRTADDPDTVFVTTTTLAVFVVMMVGVIAGVTQPVDPRVLATEPMAERQLGIGLLAASAAGPPGLSAVLLGVGLFAGAIRGIGSIVPVALTVFAVLMTLLLVSRTTINGLGLLANRYPRVGQVIVGLASLAFYAAFQIVPRQVASLDGDDRTRLADLLAWTPMGQLGRALGAAGTSASLVHLVIGSVWLLPLLWIFNWSTRRLVTSVAGAAGHGRVVTNRRSQRAARTRWMRRICGHGVVGAMAWRGVLVRFRTPRTALETFTGAGVGLAIVLVPVLTGREVGAGAVLVGGAVQLAVLFMAGNSFGSDGPALSNELLTGVDPLLVVRAKARSVVVAASPIALVGPLIAAAVTDEWRYLPAGIAVGVGGLLAGAGAAMVQSALVPIAIPESDNPLASGDSGKGWLAAITLALVLVALAILTLPIALALLWAVDRDSTAAVTTFAVATIGAGLLILRGGTAIASKRWREHGPELFAAITPAR